MSEETPDARLARLKRELAALDKQEASAYENAVIAAEGGIGPINSKDPAYKVLLETRTAQILAANMTQITQRREAIKAQMNEGQTTGQSNQNKEQPADRDTQQKAAIASALYIGKKTERTGQEATLTQEFNRQAERDR